jgi:hypothetical protein
MQLPKIVAARLQRSSISEHPEPDLLTAFTEQELGGKELESVLDHLAVCAECRQILVLAAPELIPEATSSAFRQSSWLRMPVIRWGALGASIVIVAAAMLVRRGERPTPRENVAAATEQSTAPAKPPSTAQLPAMRAGTNKVPVPTSNGVPQQAAAANAASARVAHAPTSALPHESAGLAPEVSRDQQLRAHSSAVGTKTAPAFTPRPTTETAASTIGGAARFTDFRSPNWRLSDDGLPERSFTSGQWEKVQVDHTKGFRTLAALGMEVWVGGSSGLLYHSEDMGLNWTRLTPRAGSSTLSDDIISIAFADHSHGKLNTAAGQTWVTSDAGRTWKTQ